MAMSLTVVYSSLRQTDAEMVRSRLITAGFHAFIQGEIASNSIAGGALATGGITIEVPDAEAQDARALIEDLQRDSSH